MNAVPVVARRLFMERRFLVACVTLGGVAVLALQIAVYPSIRDSLDEFSATMPDAFSALVGTAEFSSPEGFLQAEAYGLMAPLLVTIVAVSVGASGTAGSESSGRMTLLATAGPSRRVIGAGAAGAMVAAVTLATGAYWLATVLGGTFGDVDIGIARLMAASASLWALGIALGGVSFAIAAGTGRRGMAVAVAVGIALGSYLTFGLLPLVDGLEGARRFSLWYPYAEHEPLWHGFHGGHFTTLVAVGSAGVVAGLVGFERRDLG